MESKTFGPFIIKEYEVINESQNQVKIAVKALRPVTSRNGRKYTFNEILESHKTMRHKPINVNHDDSRCIGNTDGSKITDKQTMEVYGTVNKEPYVYMIKTHDPKITGWSVQADFKIAKCTHCNKEFQSMETLKTHLIEVEHIHNISFEPVDIEFNGLALVLSPEVPGVPNTSHEIRETAYLMTLEETIDKLESQNDLWLLNKISNKLEDSPIMSKVVVHPEITHAAVGRTQAVVTNNKFSLNLDSKADAPLISDKSMPVTPTLNATETQPQKEAIQPLTETTLPKETATKIVLKEAVQIGKLVFEAEECTPFEQCVKDGGSPEECARKFKETVKRNSNLKAIESTVNALIEAVNKPIVFEHTQPAAYDDKPIREMIASIKPFDDSKLKEAIANIPKDDFGWRDIKSFDPAPLIAKIEEVAKTVPAAYNDKALKESLANLKIPDITPLTEKLATYETKLATLTDENKTLKETLTTIETQNKKITESLETKLKEYDSIKKAVLIADHAVSETAKAKSVFEQKFEKIEAENRLLRETVEKQEKTLKETQIRTDNLEDKQQPNFKGHNKTVVEAKQATPNFTYNPTGAV
jgi:hypothetical protein